MKKRIIVTAAITACFTLCAAVWPQAETVKETPVPNETTIVGAPKATVEAFKTEVETVLSAEEEKAEIPQQEQTQEATAEPKPVPTEIPPTPEVQPKSEQEPVTEATHEPVTMQTTEQPTTQETIESQSDDMVNVPGFGWIENQGLNQVEYAEDMYENGNKMGIMG